MIGSSLPPEREEVIVEEPSSPFSNTESNNHTTTQLDKVLQSGIETTVAFHNDINLTKLNQYISGSSWGVNYYNQLKAENDNLMPIDINSIEALQQLEKIENLELKVTSPIETNNFSDVSGEAVMAVGIEPHEGDVFITRLDNNLFALFRVIEVTYGLYNLNKIFTISYKLDILLNNNHKTYLDIEKKVVRTFVYDKNHTYTNTKPIITKSVYEDKVSFGKTITVLEKYYLNKFLDNSTRTLLVPTISDIKIVDPYNELFIFSIFTYSDMLSKINRFPVVKNDMLFNTIYGALLNKDYKDLKYLTDEFKIENKSNYTDIPILKTLRYFNTDFIVARSQNKSETSVSNDNLLLYIENCPEDEILPNRNVESHWVFSDDFYKKQTNTFLIEKLTLNYLQNNYLLNTDLVTLINKYRDWSDINQFYYIPILILLLKYKINTNTNLED